MRRILLLIGVVWFWAAVALAAPGDPKTVTLEGTLRTGLVAIGGETTGTRIDTAGGRFELEFGKDKGLRQKAEQLDGKRVVVIGTLEIRQGAEIPEPRIVIVTSLKEGKRK